MTAPVSQVLSEAADLLEKPGAWTQKALSRDASGRLVHPFSAGACSFCMAGAIGRVVGTGSVYCEETLPAMDFVEGILDRIPSYNDHPRRTQGQIVATLRRAAALAKEQGR